MTRVIRAVVLALIFAVLVVGYFFYLTRMAPTRATEEAKVAEQSELERVLSADFQNNYPATPREVMKWYNRILTLYYSGEPSSRQVDQLCDQALSLMDQELKEENPRDDYIQSVKYSIGDYKEKGRKIIEYKVADTKKIKEKQVNGKRVAYVLSYYFLRDGNDYEKTYQMYALRKDRKGRYKILAFQLADENGNVLEAAGALDAGGLIREGD